MDIPSIESLSRVLGSVLEGSQDPVVNEILATFRLYFDHSDFLSSETKHFIREFETKRSHEDKEAIEALLRQQKMTTAVANSIPKAEKHLQHLVASIESTKQSINEILEKEEEFSKKTDGIIEEIIADTEEQQVQFSKEMTTEYSLIDKQWEENVKKLEEVYYISPETKERLRKRKEELESKANANPETWFSKRLV